MHNLHLGTIGWSYNFWKGNFYPNKTASKDFLTYFGTQFNTVEVDSTFYRIPTQQTVTNWKRQTPKDFIFSLKFPQVITHVKMLKDCPRETNVFLDRAELLGEKLGHLLMQFPPNFGIEHLPDLTDFLRMLPKLYRYVVEVRNKTWLNQEFYSLLRDNKVAMAWTDSPILAPISEVTSDFFYVRWEGDRKKVQGTLGKIEVDKTADLRLWAEKIMPFVSKQEVFGYFSKYYSGYPPSDIIYLQSLLNGNQALSLNFLGI